MEKIITTTIICIALFIHEMQDFTSIKTNIGNTISHIINTNNQTTIKGSQGKIKT